MNVSLKPNLIESNVKYFLNSTLENSHKFKENYFNNIFNIVAFISLVLFIIIILLVKYKGTKNTKEIELKKKLDKQYIIQRLLKIKQDNINERNLKNNLITNLPVY
tara:strand:- start:1517 stop:1834 length:318 start_codon:yes stop_codon:yes gene_type:complete